MSRTYKGYEHIDDSYSPMSSEQYAAWVKGTNPRPRYWREWQRILRVAPALKGLMPFAWPDAPPPRRTANGTIIALAACFADPVVREALRAIIFDLLEDDLAEVLRQFEARSRKRQ